MKKATSLQNTVSYRLLTTADGGLLIICLRSNVKIAIEDIVAPYSPQSNRCFPPENENKVSCFRSMCTRPVQTPPCVSEPPKT